MQDAYAHCEALVRAADKDRYLAGLFAPAAARRRLYALYAFAAEITRVREAAREPLPGEIRLQWWRDVLTGEGRGEVLANPVAAALIDTIAQCGLPKESLIVLIDAHAFDLYDDAMPSLNDLEGYCGETSSRLIQLASMILADGQDPGAADAAGHAGVAYAITGLLRAFPWHARRGQIYIPKDVLTRHGVVREDIVTGRGGPGLAAALADMRAIDRRHLDQARQLRATVPAGLRPAFRPLALVEPYLGQMERSGYDPFRTPVALPQWRRLWALWRGGL
jgi:15-cis-phytoene synthase